jgi:hypothetical protein
MGLASSGRFLFVGILLAIFAHAQPQHVILITIDGGAAYQLENPDLLVPNVRELIGSGVWAQSSETVFPSETHPSHTTIVTGVLPEKHGDLSNEIFDRAHDTRFAANSLPHNEAVRTRTIFDTAKAKGLTTASVLWPESNDDPSIDFNFMIRTTGKQRVVTENAWIKELRAEGVPVDLDNRMLAANMDGHVLDYVSTLALCEAIRKHKTNLAAIHLIETDGAEHTYGPSHPLAQAAFHDVDAMIGQIVAATKEAGIYDRTAFVVTADHGFTTVHYELNLRPYFAAAGLTGKVKLYAGGWSLFVRLLPGFAPDTDEPKLRQALHEIQNNPHILRIYRSADYPSLGLPEYEKSDRIPGQYLIVSDIDTFLVQAPDNSTELRQRRSPAYSHGYLPQYPAMYPLLVLAGDGFRKGVRIGHVRQIDIAPTITRLLGLEPLDFDGRVLTEALQPER